MRTIIIFRTAVIIASHVYIEAFGSFNNFYYYAYLRLTFIYNIFSCFGKIKQKFKSQVI